MNKKDKIRTYNRQPGHIFRKNKRIIIVKQFSDIKPEMIRGLCRRFSQFLLSSAQELWSSVFILPFQFFNRSWYRIRSTNRSRNSFRRPKTHNWSIGRTPNVQDRPTAHCRLRIDRLWHHSKALQLVVCRWQISELEGWEWEPTMKKPSLVFFSFHGHQVGVCWTMWMVLKWFHPWWSAWLLVPGIDFGALLAAFFFNVDSPSDSFRLSLSKFSEEVTCAEWERWWTTFRRAFGLFNARRTLNSWRLWSRTRFVPEDLIWRPVVLSIQKVDDLANSASSTRLRSGCKPQCSKE